MISSEVTNSVTNFAHAAILATYSGLLTARSRRLSDANLARVAMVFWLLFAMKVLGVAVHAQATPDLVRRSLWLVVAALSIALNASIFYAMGERKPFVATVGILTATCAVGFSIETITGKLWLDFIWLAGAFASAHILAAIRAQGLLRLAWAWTAASHFVWMGSAVALRGWLGRVELAPYAFHNDLYHLLLMAASTMHYKAAVRGLWARSPAAPSVRVDAAH